MSGASLVEVVELRRQRVAQQAARAAGRLRDAGSADLSVQLEVEDALGELRLYRDLTELVGEYRDLASPYQAHAPWSLLADVARAAAMRTRCVASRSTACCVRRSSRSNARSAPARSLG